MGQKSAEMCVTTRPVDAWGTLTNRPGVLLCCARLLFAINNPDFSLLIENAIPTFFSVWIKDSHTLCVGKNKKDIKQATNRSSAGASEDQCCRGNSSGPRDQPVPPTLCFLKSRDRTTMVTASPSLGRKE